MGPQNPILIIKAPILLWTKLALRALTTWVMGLQDLMQELQHEAGYATCRSPESPMLLLNQEYTWVLGFLGSLDSAGLWLLPGSDCRLQREPRKDVAMLAVRCISVRFKFWLLRRWSWPGMWRSSAARLALTSCIVQSCYENDPDSKILRSY